ncbi:MAG: tRNA pseudouridine(55) synthase TruB, partial [Tenericutes bacterium HGW-Tenericutes-8]
LIDKPEGMTSFDVIRDLRKKLKTKEIGHAGTLDPMATGLLVVLVGRTTKLSNLMLNKIKTYEAEITFGFSTDTYDRMGKVVEKLDTFHLTQTQIESALAHIKAQTTQKPPIYSAIKVDGMKLYEYARKDIAVDIQDKDVTIHQLETTKPFQDNRFECIMTVSKGTYVRTIAHDLGIHLGVPAHLSKLRRTKSGEFEIENASRLDQDLKPVLTLVDYANTLEKVSVDDYMIPLIKNGIRLDERQTTIEVPFTAISKTGELLAIYQKDIKDYKPIIQLGV